VEPDGVARRRVRHPRRPHAGDVSQLLPALGAVGVRGSALGGERVSGSITITDHLGPDDIRDALRADVFAGLRRSPKQLPPKWFYDDIGSELFDKITRLTEYYPTEAERAALRDAAAEIAALSGADTLVELGSGSSDKTRVLLDALDATGRLR